MKIEKVEKRLIVFGFSVLLLLIIGSFLFLEPKFTGFVVGPSGEQCDGNWTCSDWGECTDGNQTRDCTSDDSLNCTSPITELQSCVVECAESWTCSEWGECTDGNQTRTCEDANECGTEEDMPELIQSCISCEENWTCTEWSECADSSQTRTCTDSALCETNASKPTESQSCTMPTSCGDGDCTGNEDCESCSDDCGDCDEDEETSSTTSETSSESSEITSEVIESSCVSNWECLEWRECVDRTQTRECIDQNNCVDASGMPATSQSCEIPGSSEIVEEVISETCSDEIQNQDEEGIDCGGVCEQSCRRNIFSLVGNVVKTPIDSGKQFFQKNKKISFIILGVLVFGVAGLVTFKYWKKKIIKE